MSTEITEQIQKIQDSGKGIELTARIYIGEEDTVVILQDHVGERWCGSKSPMSSLGWGMKIAGIKLVQNLIAAVDRSRST